MLTTMDVLDLGRLTLDQNLMVGNSSLATRSNPHAQHKLIDVPVSSYCIHHTDGHILFDVGCNPNPMGEQGRWAPLLQDLCPYSGGEECQLPNRLEQMGIGPNDIRYAVLSHLHNDHAGCVEYFKKSQLIVHKNEFAAALSAYGMRQDNTPYVRKDIERWTQTDLNWRLVEPDEGDLTLADGVEILNFGPGHADGMLGLRVELPETGNVILTSDAVYSAANFSDPIQMPGVVKDSAGAMRTVRRIRELETRHNAQVWFGHDLDQFATLRKSTEGCYA